MRRKILLKAILQFMLITGASWALSTNAFAVEYNLRADVTTMVMPDGQAIPMWGFALDSAFGVNDGIVTVPGPLLTVPEGDNTLTVHLKNNLTPANTGLAIGYPVSLVIPGQVTAMTPARFNLAQYPQYPQFEGRIRSLTHETMPDNATPVDYTWTNLKPGTYIYHSGTHIQCHVQMGLYGAVKKDAALNQAYAGVTYDKEAIIFYSEIDPAFHQAVATNNYGPGKAMTSAINYSAKYFLVNGQPYSENQLPLPVVNANERVLLRFLNAGLESHVPAFNNAYLEVAAEDGNPYPYPKKQYSVLLPAGKTIDALLNATNNPGEVAFFDRRLFLNNADTLPGGMLDYLTIIDALPILRAQLDANPAEDAVFDYGPYGIWIYYNNASWTQLHNLDPAFVTAGDLDNNGIDDLVVDFDIYGVWVYYNGASWLQLHSASPVSITVANVDAVAGEDLLVDYGKDGIWIYYNNSSWFKLHFLSPETVLASNLDNAGSDDLVFDFGPYGLWIRYNDTTWLKLHDLSPETFAAGDLDNNGVDDLVFDFGPFGVWIYYNNTGWSNLHPVSPDSISVAQLDAAAGEDLIMDYGSDGIWAYYNNAAWTQLQGLNPEFIISGNLDALAGEEAVIDFGPLHGVWGYYNNSAWVKIHDLSP